MTEIEAKSLRCIGCKKCKCAKKFICISCHEKIVKKLCERIVDLQGKVLTESATSNLLALVVASNARKRPQFVVADHSKSKLAS